MSLRKGRNQSCVDGAIQRLAMWALVLVGCLLPLSSFADSDAGGGSSGVSNDAPELRRELAGHLFIPSRFTTDPFVSTFVASETGFGYGTAPGYTFDVNGKVISSADYALGAFVQLLEFQYGVFDWWAVRVSTRITLYSGINQSGVVAVGTTILGNVGVGTTMSWKVGETLRLGGAVDVSFGPSVWFNVLNAVKSSIEQGEIVSPVNSTSGFSFLPAFTGAWAIEKWVGLTFSANYSYSTATNGTTTGQANLLSANAVFDFDLGALQWVPIGFLAGFQTSFSVDSTQFLQYRYQFGVFYTGVPALNVGLEVVYLRAPVVGATPVFVSSIQGLIVLQYNFN